MKKNTLKQSFALSLMLCASGLIAAEAPSVDQRLNQLEKTVQDLKKENSDLRSQLGWDGKAPLVVAKPAGKENAIKVGGYLQGQFETGDAPDARYTGIKDRALIRRARINVTGSFKEDFDFKVEGDFGANALSEQTAYRAQITDAFVNWNRYSFANVKFGQFKTPFGYEQLVADTKLLTVERSLANDRITDGRQIGLGISGDFFNKRLGYSVGGFNGSGVNNSFNDNESFLWAGRITGVAFEGKLGGRDTRVAVGVNGLSTHDKAISKTAFGFDSVPGGAVDNLFSGRRTSWGVDAQLKWWLFGLEGEYLQAHFEPSDVVPFNALDADGWYVIATAEVWPKHLQAFAKFEAFDPNRSLDTVKTSELWTFGLNYFIKGDDIKLSLNYLIGNPAPGGNNQERMLARVQVVF